MSISTITAAERVELRDATLTAALAMQRYTQSGATPRADEVAQAAPILNAAAAALTVAGATGLPATSAVVANGAKVNAVSVTGTGNFATFTVANGVITAIVLSAS